MAGWQGKHVLVNFYYRKSIFLALPKDILGDDTDKKEAETNSSPSELNEKTNENMFQLDDNRMENFFGYNEINKSQHNLEKFNKEIDDHFNGKDTITRLSKSTKLLLSMSKGAIPKIYKTKTIYDSMSEEEDLKNSELLLAPSPYSPQSKCLCLYKTIIYFVILCHISVAFYWMSFNPIIGNSITDPQTKFLILMDFIVLFQFLFSLIIAFDAEDSMVIQFKAIAKLFQREGILTDIIISIPFFYINFILSSYSQGHENIFFQSFFQKIFCHGRWLKFFVLLRFNSNADKLISQIDVSYLDLIVSAINYILYFHFTACIWIYTSSLIKVSFSAGWIQYYFNNDDQTTVYIASLYFNFVTLFTVGYGDIVPHHVYEYFLLIFILIISATIYAVLFSTISSIFTSTEKKSQILGKKKDIIDQIDTTSKIPENLKNKIMSFYSNSLNMNRENKNNLMESLPPKMKNELLTEMYGRTVKNLKFLHGCKEDFNFYILGLLKPFTLEKGEILLGLGSFYTDVYFVAKGQLDFFIPLNTKHARFYSLRRGENFGEINILANEAIDYKVCSSKKKPTELLLLSKERLLDIKAGFPALFKEKIKKSLQSYQIMDNNKLLYLDKFTKEVKDTTDYKKMLTKVETIIDSPPRNMNFPSPFVKNRGLDNRTSNFTELKLEECGTLEQDKKSNSESFIQKNILEIENLAFEIDKFIKKIHETENIPISRHCEPRTIIVDRKSKANGNMGLLSPKTIYEGEDTNYYYKSSNSPTNGLNIKIMKFYMEDNCQSLHGLKRTYDEPKLDDDYTKIADDRWANGKKKKRAYEYEAEPSEKLIHNKINDEAIKKVACSVLKKSKINVNSNTKSHEDISEVNKVSIDCSNHTLHNSRIGFDLTTEQHMSIISKNKAEGYIDRTKLQFQISLKSGGLKNAKSCASMESPLHNLKNPSLKKKDSTFLNSNPESDRSKVNELTLNRSRKLMSIIQSQTKTEYDGTDIMNFRDDPFMPKDTSYRLNMFEEQLHDFHDIEYCLKKKIKERQSKKNVLIS